MDVGRLENISFNGKVMVLFITPGNLKNWLLRVRMGTL
jgi:hypothetical protein